MRKMLILGLVTVLSMGRPMIPFPIEEGALNRMVDMRMSPADCGRQKTLYGEISCEA